MLDFEKYIEERYLQIQHSPSFLLEIKTLEEIPDGKEYYDHIINNVELDRSNPKNSYVMWACGKVDQLDQTKSCAFTEAASSLPDIDVDFPPSHREQAIDYVRHKYGEDCVSQVITFSRLKGRSALTAVMSADGSYSFEQVKNVTKDIPDEAAISDDLAEMEIPSILLWVLENDPGAVKDYCYMEDGELKGEYAEVFRKAIKLEDTLRSQGRHAAGVIISSEPIANNAPMVNCNGVMVCGFEKRAAEKAGLVKFDFLGVEILEKIQEVLGNDISKIPLDDEKVWELLESGNTKGCFQMESFLGSSWSGKLKPKSIEQVSDVISLIRPGTLCSKEDGKTMIQHFLDRKNLVDEVPKIHELVDKALEKTYSVILYQEQAMRVCRDIAKFNMVQANKLRKAIGSKDAILMKEVKREFYEGCKNNNIEDSITERVFNMIESANRYGFNKCLSPKTLVKTVYEGYKILDDLEIGDYIDSPYGFIEVVEIYESGEKELFGVLFENRFQCHYIECTMDHEFQCADHIKRPLKDIIEENIPVITESGRSQVFYYKSCGVRRTLDIEVDHPQHVFYGNGIATSNSHGIGYSFLTYYSAYCKAHYPLQFYRSWLSHAKNKLKPHTEVYYLVNSAKKDDVDIVPPSVIHKEKDFFIKDGRVHFGLTSIKNVSNKELDKLFNLDITNWETLCWDLLSINKKTVDSLIEAGAFDYLKKQRVQMLHEMARLRDLTDKNVEWVKAHCQGLDIPSSLLKLSPTKKEGGGSHSVKGKEKVLGIISALNNPGRKLLDTPSFIATKEEQLMGVALSSSYLDECSDKCAADTTCKEFLDGKSGKMSLSVQIMQVKEHKIKKEGPNKDRKMAFISAKDDTCEVESIIAFPDSYELFSELLMEKNTVILFGERNKDSFNIEKVYQI